jgi:DNA invertase Pin-like site-specific DNA recombinase
MTTADPPKQLDMISEYHAYLRVSTDAQDVDNQRHGILEYANAHGFAKIKFTEDSASGKSSWKERKLGALVESINPADVLIFAEISRIARSTLQVLEVLERCAARGIAVHIAKQNMRLDDSMQSRITATVLGLAAEIEREFISMRTKEALAKCRAEGIQLGRPKGQAERVKLDDHETAIRGYLAKGINKRDIARLIECAPSTLYEWLKRRNIKTPSKA